MKKLKEITIKGNFIVSLHDKEVSDDVYEWLIDAFAEGKTVVEGTDPKTQEAYDWLISQVDESDDFWINFDIASITKAVTIRIKKNNSHG